MSKIEGQITSLHFQNPRVIFGAVVEQLVIHLRVQGSSDGCSNCSVANCSNNPNSQRRENDRRGQYQVRTSHPSVIFSRTNPGKDIATQLGNGNCAPFKGPKSHKLLEQIEELPAIIIPQTIVRKK